MAAAFHLPSAIFYLFVNPDIGHSSDIIKSLQVIPFQNYIFGNKTLNLVTDLAEVLTPQSLD